jgi:hypothetical protein
VGSETRDWHDIVTLDKSWFYSIADHELIFFLAHGKVPDLERVTIQSKKVMLTIVWRPIGFTFVIALGSDFKFNVGYCVSKVLTQLSEWWCEDGGGNGENPRVHADNVRPTKPPYHKSS